MIDEEYIKAEIRHKEQKRKKALMDKCELVARRYEREIAALTEELNNSQSINQ